MKKTFFLFFLTISLAVGAQNDVRWSELTPVKGRISSILPISYSDFYTTRYSGPAIFPSLYLTKHSNFEVTSKGKVTAKLDEGTGIIQQVTIIKDQPFVFISDKKDGKNTLYLQKYDNTCKPASLRKIASYDMPKGWKRRGSFWVHVSQNKEFFVVDYEIPGNKEEKDRFGYVVYDDELNMISEGEYELPYESSLVSISNNYLSNTGDYFLAAKVYKKSSDSKKIFKSRVNLDKIVLMHVTPNGIEEFDLKLKGGKYISDLSFSSDNNSILSFTGLYSDQGYGNVKGVFFFQLDFAKKTMMNEGWEEFTTDFITSDWSDRAKKKAAKRAAKGKGEPELYEYDIRNIHTLKDGSMIGMLEQFYIRVVTTTDSKGNTRTTYYYYYNDVIVYKVNKNGGFEWVKKIKKSQVSVNDGGFFSSIASYATDDKLVILFNDNLKNYNDNGYFIDDKNSFYSTSYRKRTNCVAKVEIDLAAGDIDRSTYFDRKETKAYAVPKMFRVDYNKNEMLMVLLYGRKEKYGVLSF